MTTLNTNDEGESIYGSVNLLDTGCSRQYLYCLQPQSNLLKDPKMMQNATNIGKLDIVWRSNLGERGRLQTSQLQRMVCCTILQQGWLCIRLYTNVIGLSQAPEYGDLRVIIKDIPLKAYLEEPVNCTCHIINTS